MNKELQKPVTYIKGVGPKKSELYEKLGVKTLWDMLNFFPRSYIDYSQPIAIADAPENENVIIKGSVVRKLPGARVRKGLYVYKAVFTDGESDITIVFYNNHYVFDRMEIDKEYILSGKIMGNIFRKEMNTPQVIEADSNRKMQPVYHLTEGLTQVILRQNMGTALENFGRDIYEPVPKYILGKNKLCSLEYAMENIHFPKDPHTLELAKNRLVFDELLTLQLGMMMMKSKTRQKTGSRMKMQDMEDFYDSLPFELTKGQKDAIDDCIGDMQKSFPMNRLIQGDVGSGKTAVAAGAACFVYKNGGQTALMAPTEILANQHYETLKSFLEPLGVKVCLLTGSVSKKQKDIIKEKLLSGEISVAVGTHALIQRSTEFKSLDLVITDEQHRFGVNQRAMLESKGDNPHTLVMSATPIPRTLALMIYGDLDISSLREMPKGRLPVKTYAVTGKLRERSYNYVRKFLEKGLQGYGICPMIEDNDMELQSVNSYAENLRNGILKGFNIGVLHGKMTGEQKEKIMLDFKDKKIDFLVATTVVEVGVDVPNAAIMVIENSDRFGLSQLHQLRGRVGRGKVQSECILITDNVTEDVRTRLKIMSSVTDGFKISEEDLKLRGPGDFFGSRQHGLPNLKIADMSQDLEVLRNAQRSAKEILDKDPELESAENKELKVLVDKLFENKISAN